VKFDLNKLLNDPFTPPDPPEGDLHMQVNLFEWKVEVEKTK